MATASGGRQMITTVLAAAGAASLVLVASGPVGAASPVRAAARARPACTRAAIKAAALRDRVALGPVHTVNSFGCSGRWAYAGVTIGTTHAFDAVVVLHARGRAWVVANRTTACIEHLVPRPIYRRACTTS